MFLLHHAVFSQTYFRNNKIKSLPEGVPGAEMVELTLLHLSSNRLESLPSSLLQCTCLEYLYLNSNHLTAVPSGLADALILLKRLTLSHNRLTALPPDFIERFGEPKDDKCHLDPTCIVTLACNPVLNDQPDAMNVV